MSFLQQTPASIDLKVYAVQEKLILAKCSDARSCK